MLVLDGLFDSREKRVSRDTSPRTTIIFVDLSINLRFRYPVSKTIERSSFESSCSRRSMRPIELIFPIDFLQSFRSKLQARRILFGNSYIDASVVVDVALAVEIEVFDFRFSVQKIVVGVKDEEEEVTMREEKTSEREREIATESAGEGVCLSNGEYFDSIRSSRKLANCFASYACPARFLCLPCCEHSSTRGIIILDKNIRRYIAWSVLRDRGFSFSVERRASSVERFHPRGYLYSCIVTSAVVSVHGLQREEDERVHASKITIMETNSILRTRILPTSFLSHEFFSRGPYSLESRLSKTLVYPNEGKGDW
nr:uncharacterized protein LOC116430014 [Nomia melanderi]